MYVNGRKIFHKRSEGHFVVEYYTKRENTSSNYDSSNKYIIREFEKGFSDEVLAVNVFYGYNIVIHESTTF